MRTGGQVLADGLVAHGSELAFCVPGESYLALLDGLYEHRDAFRIVNCRHEGAAANAADAYGKLTGRPGLCFVTRGPGATHAAAGIHTAQQDSTPLLMLVGQVSRNERGRESFQELDYEAVFGPMAKWAFEIDDPERIPEVLARAYTVATSGRPGPVVLALPEDVLSAEVDVPDAPRYRALRPAPSPEAMEELGALLEAAERPFVLVGGGPWDDDSAQAFTRWALACGLPVGATFRRQDVVDNTCPSYAGDVGIGHQPGARAADPRLRPAGGGRHAADRDRDAGLHAARAAGRAAAARARAPRPGRARARLPAVARGAERGGGVRGRRAARRRRALGGLDRGRARRLRGVDPSTPRRPATASTWARWSPTCATRSATTPCSPTAPATSPAGSRASTSGGASARSSGRRAARWATACRRRWRRSSCTPSARSSRSRATATSRCAGMELATAVQEGLPILVIVVNNGTYGTIRMHQERRFPARVIATDLANPDFAGLARAYGAHGERIEHAAEFPDALAARADVRRAGADRADHGSGSPDAERVADRDPRRMRTATEIAELVNAGELDPVAVIEEALERIAGDADLNAIMVTNGERALARARARRARPARRRAAAGQGPDRRRRAADHLRLAHLRRPHRDRDGAVRAPRSRPRARSSSPPRRATSSRGASAARTRTGATPATRTARAASPAARARGNAAALAVGMGALALGTDTGGSVRVPAAACGVVGLKTPFGAISTEGVFPLVPALDTVGPMARTVEDCALAWSMLSGEPVPEPSLEGKRLGKLTRLPSLGEPEPAPHDPRTDALPGEPVELPVPENDVWPVFYAGAAESHHGLFPEREAQYGPAIRAKLTQAVRTTPEAARSGHEAMAAWQRAAAPGPAGRRHRLARARPPGAARDRDARGGVPDRVLLLRAPVQLPRLARDRHRRHPAGGPRHAHVARDRARLAFC